MIHPVRRYRALSEEQKLVIRTEVSLCASAALACGKFLMGLVTNVDLVAIALYTFAILLAKWECVCGIKSEKLPFAKRNLLVAGCLLAGSLLYIGFLCRVFFVERKIEDRGMAYVLLLAFVSFTELGFAVSGLLRTWGRGHYFRTIRIINFCAALIAILTTQTAILDMTQSGAAGTADVYTGIGIGCFTALCAVYILAAPKLSPAGREHRRFVLNEAERNRLIDFGCEEVELLLCRSRVYGDYLFRAAAREGAVEGDVVRAPSLWKRMHVVWKIFCCILSELLVFAWLFGRAVLFFRTIGLYQRLERRMRENGFTERPHA